MQHVGVVFRPMPGHTPADIHIETGAAIAVALAARTRSRALRLKQNAAPESQVRTRLLAREDAGMPEFVEFGCFRSVGAIVGTSATEPECWGGAGVSQPCSAMLGALGKRQCPLQMVFNLWHV